MAIRKATNTTNHPDMGRSYESMAEIHKWERNYTAAIDIYQQALALYQSKYRADHPRIGGIYHEIGKVYGTLKQYDRGLSFLEKAIKIDENQQEIDRIDVAWDYAVLADLYAGKGEKKEALHQLQNGLAATVETFEWSNIYDNPSLDKIILKRTLLQLFSKKILLLHEYYDNHTGNVLDLKAAFKTGESAIELIELNRRDYQFDAAKQLLLTHSSNIFRNTLNIGFKLLEQEESPDLLARIYEIMEKNRGVLLQESIITAQTKASSDIPDNLLNKEKQLKKELADLKHKLLLENYENKLAQDSLEHLVFNCSQKMDSLYLVFATDYPSYQQLALDLTIPNFDRIAQELLDKETALLEYTLVDSNLFVLAVTTEGVQYHNTIIDTTFYQQLSEIRDFFSGRFQQMPRKKWREDRKKYSKNAFSLHQQLLVPILSKIKTPKHLIIIPDGLLNFIPFEALLTDWTPAMDPTYDQLAYLINDYSVRYEYATSLSLLEKKRKVPPPHLFAGFAPEYSGGNLIAARRSSDSITIAKSFQNLRSKIAPLEFNQPEVKDITQIVGGKIFQGNLATEGTFKKEAKDYQILHLAMHGFVNDAYPNHSHLVFSESTSSKEDRFLYAYELYNMDFKADLAVLSACETGAGKIQKGEGVMSLSRAFKYAGVSNVVMSLWKADDAQTRNLMLYFYKMLHAGNGKSEALRAAKLKLIAKAKDNKETAHPFYWANFILMGNDTPIIVQRNNWRWFAGLGLLVCLLLFWTIKRK